MIRALILAVLLIGGAANAAEQATPPLSFVAGKLQQSITTDRLLGRDTTGTGAVEELTVGGGIEFTGSGGIQRGALTGDVTASAGSSTTAIASGAVTNANLASNAVTSGKVQDGTIAANDMTEGFIASYAGTGLAADTTTSPDSLKVANDGVALGTNTTGNYVATVAGTANEVSVSGSGSETAAVTVGLPSAVDLGGKTSFEVPNGSGPTTNVFGQIAGDNDAWAASRGAAQWYDGTANTFLVGAQASDTPANWQVPRWNTGGTVTWENSDRTVTASSLGLHCAYSADDTSTLRSALEAGGAAAGKTIFIPSGCKVLLGSPGAGDSVADVASDTTIECEDNTAGFVLARKSCSDASETPGAACTADNQCKSGTCDPDYPAGTSFAPTEASTYTVFGAASGTKNPAIRRCGIWVNQNSGDPPALGGAGKRWGYCDGAGTSVTGEGCFNACNSSSGVYEGFACLTNADCGAGSCTARAGNCKSLGGACNAVPYATNWGPSGPGKINPIAWANADGARVEDVHIYDHRRGDAGIEVGTSGLIIDSTTNGDTLTVNQAAGQIFGSQLYSAAICGGACTCSTTNHACRAPTVAKGIVAGASTDVIRSVGYGWTAGVHAKGANHVTNTVGGGYGDPSQSGWDGNTDLLVSSAGVIASGFIGGSSLYCVLPDTGYNFLIQNAYCDGNVGPKFIVQGSGNQYMGVRGAWHGVGSIVGLGEQRGRCSGGTRSGKVCIAGAGTNATIGCPSSTCAAHADFVAGSTNHFVIGGGSLLHSELGSDVSFLRGPESKRCVHPNATNRGAPCTSDGDCSTGTCDYLTFINGLIDGVLDYYGNGGATAFDLSTSGIGVSPVDGPTIANWSVSGMLLQGFGTGFKFPGSPSRICTKGTGTTTTNGTSCTVDSDCSCTGGGCVKPVCRGPISDFAASVAMASVTTPLSGWRWWYGDVSGVVGLASTDDQGKPVNLIAGEALSRGWLVKFNTSGQAIRVATTDTGEQAYGVVLDDAASSGTVKVMPSGGIALCMSDTGTITAGDLLERGTSTAGRVKTVDASSDNVVGMAMETDGSSGSLFRCAIRSPGVQSAAATPFQTQFLTADAATQAADTVVNTQFSFTLSANKTYILDGALIVSGGSTGDMRCNLDGPASMTTVLHGYNNGTTMTVSGDNTDGKCVDIVAGSDNVVNVGGLVVTGASGGSLDWKWAQNVSNGVGTTVKAGSWMRIMER